MPFSFELIRLAAEAHRFRVADDTAFVSATVNQPEEILM